MSHRLPICCDEVSFWRHVFSICHSVTFFKKAASGASAEKSSAGIPKGGHDKYQELIWYLNDLSFSQESLAPQAVEIKSLATLVSQALSTR